MTNAASRWLALAISSSTIGTDAGEYFPEEYVNTLSGTASARRLSHGNVLPAVVRPWGMHAWVPQTRDSSNDQEQFWFSPFSPHGLGDFNLFRGVRCTHQPSPWVKDYGQFLITPSAGATPEVSGWPQLVFKTQDSNWSPYLWNASLVGPCSDAAAITMELTSTLRGAVMRVRFPANCNQTWHRISLRTFEGADVQQAAVTNGFAMVLAQVHDNHGGVPNGFTHHVVMSVEGAGGTTPSFQAADSDFGATLSVKASDAGASELIIRVATSFISGDQAIENFEQEVKKKSFDALVAEAKSEWNKVLSRVRIDNLAQGYDADEVQSQLEIFYSSLYRATQFPRLMSEVKPSGEVVHYSFYDGKGSIRPGAVSTDSGFWDAYRTVYPLLSVAYPEQFGRLVDGWVNAWQEGGWLPNWASPGYLNNMMVGSMGDVVLAEAIVKNISGFNRTAAYLAARQDAFKEAPRNSGFGRGDLAKYEKLGYVPHRDEEFGDFQFQGSQSVSRSLNYMVADHALANAAEALGQKEDAEVLRTRSKRYPQLFDNKEGFFRAKLANGEFSFGFDQYQWGDDYTEGGPWQYRFYVPHDPQGLKQVYASAGLDICDTIDTMMTGKNDIDNGNGEMIHEMIEMRQFCWGQYAHNNQPVHDALYMYLAVGQTPDSSCAARGQYWLRKTMLELYRPGMAMYPGDEDNGEMSAWYILSALGLYQLEPGGASFVLGSPLFANVTVQLPGADRTLRIEAEGNSATAPYVQSVALNGERLETLEVPYAALMAGGVLKFTMTDTPLFKQERQARTRPSFLQAQHSSWRA